MKNLAFAITLQFVIIFLILLAFLKISYGQTIENYQFPNDYRGIIHLHSELSHDSGGKFANIVEAAKNNQIDFVVMTDHWSPDLYKNSYSGFCGNVLFITGTEISKNEGVTLIALPLPENFVPENDWRKNVASLHKKGSLALGSHIEFSQTAQLVSVNGIEITNLHSILVDRSYPEFMWTYMKELWPPNWNLAYIFNSKTLKNFPRWYYLNQSVHLPAFLGNDTHDNYRPFWKFGPKLGSYDNTFKLLTTHIWVDKLSETTVVEAIKNGKSFFAFEIFGNAKGFRFYATDGVKVILPGGTAPPSILTVQAPPHQNSNKTKIRILKESKVIKEGTGILLIIETNKQGNYYAEIWKDGKPWIFSNPIKIIEK